MHAYQDNPGLKSRAVRHFRQQPVWWRPSAADAPRWLHVRDIDAFERELGVPRLAAALHYELCKGMADDAARQFPVRFLEMITPGANLSAVPHQYFIWLLQKTRTIIAQWSWEDFDAEEDDDWDEEEEAESPDDAARDQLDDYSARIRRMKPLLQRLIQLHMRHITGQPVAAQDWEKVLRRVLARHGPIRRKGPPDAARQPGRAFYEGMLLIARYAADWQRGDGALGQAARLFAWLQTAWDFDREVEMERVISRLRADPPPAGTFTNWPWSDDPDSPGWMQHARRHAHLRYEAQFRHERERQYLHLGDQLLKYVAWAPVVS